ncbi:MAG: haloacid dehalogenase, partial [Dehalococcoidia bacterium]|nr:haloacid dehalogenase [Dehalococcoidia bacterium]
MDAKSKKGNDLEMIADKIRSSFAEKDAAREICLKNCREIIRLSSTSIRATHRRNKEDALEMIDSASKLVNQLQTDYKKKYSELLSANYVHDAFKEYAEASITFKIIFDREIPGPDGLKVAYPAYLNGLAESVGELRRFILDGLRTNDF